MNRRDFFRFGIRNAAKLAAETVAGKFGLSDERWIRPPYALAETDFLQACTKCGACIDACSYDVLFNLPKDISSTQASTPVMDLLVSGCHLCNDWPCVAVCEPKALQLPTSENGEPPTSLAPLPKLARAVVDAITCLPYAGPECGVCVDACPVPGAFNWIDGVKPFIDETICTGCALCREVCIVDPKAIDIFELTLNTKGGNTNRSAVNIG